MSIVSAVLRGIGRGLVVLAIGLAALFWILAEAINPKEKL